MRSFGYLKNMLVVAPTLALAQLGVQPSFGADDADALLRRAERAMGGVDLKSIRFVGSGTGTIFGQAYKPGAAWPRATYSTFARVVDFENAAMREEFARARAEPTGGGALPLMGAGEQRATAFVRGNDAWNMTGPTTSAPAWVALDGRVHDLWTTPHGVIKAALRNKARLSFRNVDGKSLAAVSFTEPGRFSATALLNSDYLVERVESRQPNHVLGDISIITDYADYRDHGGVKFPARMRQSQGGLSVLDVEIKEVQANLGPGIQTPEAILGATEKVTAEKVADGVWFMGGGSHNSVAIEMKDHLVLVESPLFDGRVAAVLAEANKLVVGKAVRYVINSHHHFDHAGGLRAAAAAGAMLVVSKAAKPYFERAFANPSRINPDLLAKSGRKAKFVAVDGRRVFSDATRTIDVRFIEDSVHAEGFMMVYLPKEKLLIEADAFTPSPPNAPAPAQANGNNVNLAQNIDKLKLDVDRILPLHGRVVPLAELHRMIGRKP